MTTPEVRLKDLCEDAGQYGLNVPASEYASAGVRMLRTTDLGPNGQLRDDVDPVFVGNPPGARFLLDDGDLLLTRSGSVGRSFLVHALSDPTTFAGFLIRFRPRPSIDPRFLAYVAESTPFQDAVQADAISSTIQNFNAERYANIKVPNPPLDEQRRIADFLDTETARLNHLTSAITRREELLRARHEAAIIDVAAGRGRSHEDWYATHDPWIPEAPAHWQIGPLKRWWRVIDCKHRTPEYLATGIPVISPGDVSPGHLDLARAHRFVSATDYSDLADHLRRPRRGDIVYSRNASVGIAAYVDTDARFTMGQDVCRITSARQSQRYLAYVLNYCIGAELGAAQIGTTFTRINIARLLDVHVPCPPRDEQDELAQEMDTVTAQHHDLMSVSAQHRRLLDERRQALITAAVTGQLDVTTARGIDTR